MYKNVSAGSSNCGSDYLKERIIGAIHSRTLAAEVREMLNEAESVGTEDRNLLESVQATLTGIRESCIKTGNDIVDQLAKRGISGRFNPSDVMDAQSHQIRIEIDRRDLTQALAIVSERGYQSFGTAKLIYSKRIGKISLFNVDNDSNRMEFQWTSPKWSVLKPIRTSSEGPNLIPIPTSIRPLIFTFVSMAAVLRKLGLRKDSASIGVYLGTPVQLIPQLMEFAYIKKGDVLVDLGCGDGRILIEAARQLGCRGIGYEKEDDLCHIARERSKQQGVEKLVQIHCKDASVADLTKASVVFLFLPPKVTAKLLPDLFSKLPSNGRIVAHEILPINSSIKESKIQYLMGSSAITVAHLWQKSAGSAGR